MNMLEKLQKLIEGKKTYIIAICIGVGAVLKYQGYIIPEIVWTILAALGLGAIRAAIGKVEKPSA